MNEEEREIGSLEWRPDEREALRQYERFHHMAAAILSANFKKGWSSDEVEQLTTALLLAWRGR